MDESKGRAVGIFLRPAREADERAVYGLLCELEGPGLDRQAFHAVYSKNLKDPSVFYRVAEMNDCVMGFGSLHVQALLHHTESIGEIQELVITKECRGMHLGSALFEALLRTARENGCMQLEVCCRKGRTASHAFYESMGMEGSHFKFCLPLETNEVGSVPGGGTAEISL